MAKKTDELLALIGKYLLNTPKNLAEGVWRGVALWLTTVALSCAWLLVTDTEGFLELLPFGGEAASLSERTTKDNVRRRVIMLISKFVETSNPLRVALVSQDAGIEVKLVWNSDRLNRPWPTSVDGVLSSDFRPILGDLIFEECWEGSLGDSGRWYVMCGLKNSEGGHAGFLIAEKEKRCEKFLANFRLLAGQVGRIVFNQA